MAVSYSRNQPPPLITQLEESLKQVNRFKKKENDMATRKKKDSTETTETVTKERAAVGRERRLALALRTVLDSVASSESLGANEADSKAVTDACAQADILLTEFGYKSVESIPKRLARLNAELDTARANENYDEVARLGKELAHAKAGKFHRVGSEKVVAGS